MLGFGVVWVRIWVWVWFGGEFLGGVVVGR